MVTAFCLVVTKLPAGLTLHGHLGAGGRISEIQCGEFFNQCSRALYVLVGIARRNVPDAGVFRHGSITGSTLPFRRVIARRPARSHVQCCMQNPDAVLHLAARRDDFCLLSSSNNRRCFSMRHSAISRRAQAQISRLHAIRSGFQFDRIPKQTEQLEDLAKGTARW